MKINRSSKWWAPVNPVALYVLAGAVWILASDKLLYALVKNTEVVIQISMYKGWLYVFLTGLLLYFLLVKDFGTIFKLNRSLTDINQELVVQNEETRALYEELFATEEVLHANYDELQLYKNELEDQAERYRLVLQASQEGFWDYLPLTDRFEISDRALDVLGLGRDDVEAPENLLHRIHPLERASISQFFDASALHNNYEYSLDMRFLNNEGTYRWIRLKCIITMDDDLLPIRYTGSLEDIHQQVLQQEKIKHYAFHDAITGFFNRDYLIEHLNARMNQIEAPFPVLVVAVYGFERVASLYGKNISEILHYNAGMAIKEACEYDTLFGVLSQGKFAIVFKQADASQYAQLVDHAVETLESAMHPYMDFNTLEVPVSLVFGGTYCTHGTGSTEVIEHAETACEHALMQHDETGIHWFTPKMHVEKLRIAHAESAVKKARQYGELRLVYQPQQCACSNISETVLRGYEALIRWDHPELGLVPPDQFIPMAEENGEIINIGRFVIEEACSFIKAYATTYGTDITVSINASFKELIAEDYVDFVVQCTQKYQVGAHQLCIEITETAISKYIELVTSNLHKLKEAGFEVHLDDFGTGYSSLNHLGVLPIQVIKIDRAFVRELAHNERMRKLTALIIDMGHQMGLRIIAEGVETLEQYNLLKAMTCDCYQGYLFSKPLEKDQILQTSLPL